MMAMHIRSVWRSAKMPHMMRERVAPSRAAVNTSGARSGLIPSCSTRKGTIRAIGAPAARASRFMDPTSTQRVRVRRASLSVQVSSRTGAGRAGAPALPSPSSGSSPSGSSPMSSGRRRMNIRAMGTMTRTTPAKTTQVSRQPMATMRNPMMGTNTMPPLLFPMVVAATARPLLRMNHLGTTTAAARCPIMLMPMAMMTP